MRNVWILVASALLAFANFVKSQESARNLYSSRYDNLDIDTILGSSRLVNNYVDCLLSRKPCPPEGKDLKRILPEALRTKCSRCSVTQKENALKIITTLYYNYPEQYQALRERWDPSGEYHRRFEEYIQGLQFNQIGSNGNDRPVRNDFDRDQSQVLLQTLILSTTTPPSPSSPNVIPSEPEQRPSQQLAPSAQLTQPVAPVSITSTTSTTTIASSTTSTAIPTTTTTTITTSNPTTSAATATTGTTPTTPITTTGSSSSTNMATAETSQAPGTVAPMENPLPQWMFNRQPQEQQQQQQAQQNINTQTRPSQIVAIGAQNSLPIISGQSNANQNFNSAEPATTARTTTFTTTTTRLILRPVNGLDFITNTRPMVGVLGNRFGNDEQSTSETVEFGTTAPNPITVRPTVRVTARPVIRQTTSRIATPRPTPNRFVDSVPVVEVPFRPQPVQGQVQVFAQPQPQPQPQAPAPAQSQATSSSFAGGMTTPNNVIDNFFIPPGQGGLPANPNASPFVGLFNQIGNKLATTADVIAGMLRRTVDVLVSTHLQTHQQQQRPIRSN
ncbi:mucin-2-like isoform X2 [Ochlerotatus camptorhynchus]|uniref:mucin-2-like isoform X2 n=1 Tax=Ochlerotatus camptorhynchus TaxID=644619 RepID=UPI0031D8C3C8